VTSDDELYRYLMHLVVTGVGRQRDQEDSIYSHPYDGRTALTIFYRIIAKEEYV
jgi:hypothetical protein